MTIMAKKHTYSGAAVVDPRDQEIADLKAQLAAAGAAAAAAQGPVVEYPKAMYQKDKKQPNGYRAIRVENLEAEKALGKGWLDAPPAED